MNYRDLSYSLAFAGRSPSLFIKKISYNILPGKSCRDHDEEKAQGNQAACRGVERS